MKIFHKIISAVFQPFLVPTYAVIWLMTVIPFVDFTAKYKIVAIGFTALFTGVFPLMPIFVLMKQGVVSDINISDKNERTMPYLFAFLAYILWWISLWHTLRLPMFISAVGLSGAIALIITMFINLKWKISAHLCTMGGVFAFITGISFRLAINPILLIIILLAVTSLLALSRIELKQHTLTQVLAGFALGFVCTILPTILLSY
jgi:membrane-associated phospholipid phosphatase